MRLANKSKNFFKKNYIMLAIIAFLLAILAIGLRVETIESNPQIIGCNFNQERYDYRLKEYQRCLEDNEKPIDTSKFPKDFPAMGLMPCGVEPDKSTFPYYDKTIQYNLIKKKELKLFGFTVYEAKETSKKACPDFGFQD